MTGNTAQWPKSSHSVKQCCFPWQLQFLCSWIILYKFCCPWLVLWPVPSQPCLAVFPSQKVQNCHQDLYCPSTCFSPSFLHLSALLLPFGCSCMSVMGLNFSLSPIPCNCAKHRCWKYWDYCIKWFLYLKIIFNLHILSPTMTLWESYFILLF